MTGFDQLVQQMANLQAEELKAWIEQGWLRPSRSESDYEFSEVDVARCRFIVELKQEFEIDDETMPMVLSLVDQVYGLRRRLRLLLSAVDQAPEDTRRALAQAIEELERKD
jgi:chaperone modulatory protein CbpM